MFNHDHVCYSCGCRYNGNNHHCSPIHERGKRSAQTRANDEELRLPANKMSKLPNELPFGSRLAAGFAMLNGSES
jgi:hypothetical protein